MTHLEERGKRGNKNHEEVSLKISFFYLIMQTILVTGGTGLVGQGIRLALERTKGDGKQENENWVFLSSKDCDLLYVMK